MAEDAEDLAAVEDVEARPGAKFVRTADFASSSIFDLRTYEFAALKYYYSFLKVCSLSNPVVTIPSESYSIVPFLFIWEALPLFTVVRCPDDLLFRSYSP